MGKVAIHAPKTPVTAKSKAIAAATIPNVCKMPGPPAPFVPAPLPNIAKSGMSPKKFSKKVKIEGAKVAIFGATFKSMGDVASKGTGGGLISANTHGPAKFITPGSLTVKIENKAVHLLGEPMLNNCGPTGTPPNTGAAMLGVIQAMQGGTNPLKIDCKNAPKKKGSKKFTKCEKEELCAKCASINKQAKAGSLKRRPASYAKMRKRGNAECARLNREARKGEPADLGFGTQTKECEEKLKKKAKRQKYKGFSPDHVQEIQLGGHPTDSENLRWMSSAPNSWIGGKMKKFKTSGPNKHTGVKPNCCT